jgi:DNA modification methylase
MLNHTIKGDICYEPFTGSGTQFAAAEQEGRLCYGFEKLPKYAAVTLERMSNLGLEPKLLENE